MPRLHWFEVHDQPWCPAAVRDGITDLIQAAQAWFRAYDGIAPRLAAAVARSRAPRVVDLASGAGGPWRRLHPALAALGTRVPVVLTDRFPNLPGLRRSGLDFVAEPVDATAVPATLTGFRTLFTSFHHFRPPQARAILADAVRRGEGIGIFEITRREPVSLALNLLGVLAVLVMVPFVRPFRWDRLLVTYLVPLLPLAAAFDGFVSCLRTYDPAELRALVRDFPTYDWDIGLAPHPFWPIPVTYLIGSPRLPDRPVAG
jgi:hypothetical protein